MSPLLRPLGHGRAFTAFVVVLTLGTASLSAAQVAPAAGHEMPLCRLDLPGFQTWVAARDRITGLTAHSADKFLVPSATANDDCDGVVDLSLSQSGRFDDGFHAWIAAARCKEVVCGRADSLEPFCGGAFATGECDLNLNILVADDGPPPSARVRSLLERYQCLSDTVGLPQGLALEGGTLCFNKPPAMGWLLHSEATAPYGRARDAVKAAWASQAEFQVWRNSVAGQEMCVYGPIVGDTGHGLKAEVHPVNMYWWTRRKADGRFAFGGPYDLLMVQDASGRYGNEFGYVIRDPFPENRVWRPWSQAPIRGQFEIPVWLRDDNVVAGTCASEAGNTASSARQSRQTQVKLAAAAVPVFRIQPWRACDGAPTISDEITPPPPPQCVSRSAPRLYVDVAAKNTAYEKFDISADWACRCEEAFCGGPGYLGYLRVDGRVGLDRDFWEGALGLTVVDNRLTPAEALPACVGKALAESSRREAAAELEAPAIEARVRRILRKRNGREQEDLLLVSPATALDTLLAEIHWPSSLRPPPVEEIRRPKEVKLEVAIRAVGLDEEAVKHLDVARIWKVEIAPLPRAPEAWTTVVQGKRDQQVTVRMPQTDRPYRIRATVDLTPQDPRLPKPSSIVNELWTDRLALRASEMEGWIKEMSHICDAPVRNRAADVKRSTEASPQQLPAAVRNLLSEAGRRGEVTLTTLAILADLEQKNCPSPDLPEKQKMMLR